MNRVVDVMIRTTPRPWRRWLTLGAVLLPGVVLGISSAAPASAGDSYLRPVSGVYTVQGRGLGHAHGMSQYGARGRASAGHTWQQIMAFYYPGTTLGGIGGYGNPQLRVRLVGLSTLPVVQQQGLRVDLDSGGAASTWQVLPSTVSRSGATLTVDAWDVSYYTDTDPAAPDDSGWWLRFHPVGSSRFLNWVKVPATARTTAFDNPSTGTVRRGSAAGYSTYRGELRHVRSSATASASVVVVDSLPMESYLRGVVPNEMPATWPVEAVRSQAVAARTYADYERLHVPSGRAWDTCDTTACQVMRSVEHEHPSADAAVVATAGQVVTYNGSAAFTQFSASNGGWMLAGGQPYLVDKADPYDTYAWSRQVSAAAIERTWPAAGRLTSLTFTRDGHGPFGGRVTSVAVRGASSTVTVSGAGFASAMGLQSTMFRPDGVTVSSPSFPKDTTGDRRADVVAVVGSGQATSGQVRVYPAAGGGAFAAPVTDPATSMSGRRPWVAGTWDADAVADLMSVDGAGVLWWHRGRGNGTFEAPQQLGAGYGGYTVLSTVGDLDADGGTDIVGRRSDGTLWLIRGDGWGGVLGTSQIGSGWAGFTRIFSPGDFDGDGRTDILGVDGTGSMRLYRGTGTGSFRSAVTIGWGWGALTSVTSPGDFDGDGRPDLLARRGDGVLVLYRGNGAGGFLSGTRAVGSRWNSVDLVP